LLSSTPARTYPCTASTGPRTVVRGKRRDATSAATSSGLLQRGRAPWCAESLISSRQSFSKLTRFNGAAHRGARKAEGLAPLRDAEGPASTGPRTVVRGKQLHFMKAGKGFYQLQR